MNKVNQGVFIDSDRVFPELSKSLEIIQEDASAVHSRLLGLSKWKEAVNGLPHDLTNVNKYSHSPIPCYNIVLTLVIPTSVVC